MPNMPLAARPDGSRPDPRWAAREQLVALVLRNRAACLPRPPFRGELVAEAEVYAEVLRYEVQAVDFNGLGPSLRARDPLRTLAEALTSIAARLSQQGLWRAAYGLLRAVSFVWGMIRRAEAQLAAKASQGALEPA